MSPERALPSYPMPLLLQAFMYLHIMNIYSHIHSVCMCAKLLQLCLTLCDPMDCSLPGFSVHGISQARILEWVAMPFSGDLPGPGIEHTSLMSPALAGGLFTTSSTWGAHIFINLDVISPNDSSVLHLAKLLLHPFKFSSDIPFLRSFSNSATQASQEYPGSRMSLYKNFALYNSLHVFSLQQILSL